MRVAIVTEVFAPKIDGIVTRLCHTVQELEARGHEVHVIAPGPGPERYSRSGVTRMRSASTPWAPEVPLAFPGPTMYRALRRFQPDVVHAVNPVLLGLGGMFWADQRRVPLVASWHMDLGAYMVARGFPDRSGELYWSTRRIHGLADVNVTPSAEVARVLAGHDFERLGVWQHGTDTRTFCKRPMDAGLRAALTGGEPGGPLLVYVGRLAPEKRIATLRPLFDRIEGLSLAIVGDGDSRAELERVFAGTRTVFTGFVDDRSQLAAIYNAADASVLPSNTETLGNVLVEAQACGCPVVGAAAGGILDVIEDGESGWLYDPGSADALEKAVREALAARRQRPDQVERTRLQVRSWGQSVETLIAHYEAAVAHRAENPRRRVRRKAALGLGVYGLRAAEMGLTRAVSGPRRDAWL